MSGGFVVLLAVRTSVLLWQTWDCYFSCVLLNFNVNDGDFEMKLHLYNLLNWESFEGIEIM